MSLGLEKSKQKARKNNDFAEEAKLCNVAGEKLAEHSMNLTCFHILHDCLCYTR